MKNRKIKQSAQYKACSFCFQNCQMLNYNIEYEIKSQKYIAKIYNVGYNSIRMEVKRYVVSIYCEKLQKYSG